MRARNLKPGFFKNEVLAGLDPLARILFEGLWCMADREGRLEDRPVRIKAEILPYDDCNIESLLTLLVDNSFIIRYKHNAHGAQGYIWIPTFLQHQNPHSHEAASKLPAYMCRTRTRHAPDKNGANTGQAPDKHQKSTRQARLNPSSLNPESRARARARESGSKRLTRELAAWSHEHIRGWRESADELQAFEELLATWSEIQVRTAMKTVADQSAKKPVGDPRAYLHVTLKRMYPIPDPAPSTVEDAGPPPTAEELEESKRIVRETVAKLTGQPPPDDLTDIDFGDGPP